LLFLKNCLIKNSIDWYFSNRPLKYNNQITIIKSFENNELILPSYFNFWFSGFIEAEGCFSIRKNRNHSFSIGQNSDFYLLNAIKQFFGISSKVRNSHKDCYFLEIYKKEILDKIISHCLNFPLLGDKATSLNKFIEVYKN
jgi:LAGLIDADG endonuclease